MSAVTSVPLIPTVTDTVPETCAGVTAVITELLVRTTDVAGIPSNSTVYMALGGIKPEPIIVTEVPPSVVPEAGFTCWIAWMNKVDAAFFSLAVSISFFFVSGRPGAGVVSFLISVVAGVVAAMITGEITRKLNKNNFVFMSGSSVLIFVRFWMI